MSFINSSKTLAKGATGGIISNAASELVLQVEVLPAETVSPYYQNVGVRLFIDGEYVSIISFDETVSSQNAGKSVTVGLARIEDKALLAQDAAFLIESFEQNSPDEEPIWEIVLEGKITRKTVTFQNSDGKPADTVTFTTESHDRLQKKPTRNLVIFNSLRADVDASEFEPVYDTVGRAYTLEVLDIPNLSLYTLLEEIFVERCGFASIETNLPDYPIRRADFSIFETFYDGVKPFIGVFEARDTQTPNNILYLTDATLNLPAGFPAPRTLEAAKIQSISSDVEIKDIGGFELQFSQSETGDFYTTKNQTFTDEVRTEFGTLISKTIRRIKTRQYRSNYARRIVLREAVEKTTIEVYGADGVFPSAMTTETLTFDYLGRQTKAIKTVEKRVPEAGGGAVSLREVSGEELTHKYGVFPFAQRRRFLRRSELVETGIMAIDSENQYLSADFPQSLTLAHRGGAIKEGMTEASGVLKSTTETFKPLPDGTVEVLTVKIDHVPELVGREAIVESVHSEPRPGDVSTSASSRTNRIYVLPKDSDVLNDQKLESFAVGELPLYIAVPLARRRLERMGKQKLSIPLVGWNRNAVQGTQWNATARDGESANIFVEGYRRLSEFRMEVLNGE